MIGVGGMGMSRLKRVPEAADTFGSRPICDVDRVISIAPSPRSRKSRPDKTEGLRRLPPPARVKEIDAVVVVTPDHWHAIPTVHAFKAGKDVFVEKPLSYSVAEGRAMADASLQYKRVSQMGNHIHNDLPNYRRVVELVQSGKLGKITRVALLEDVADAVRAADDNPATLPPELDYDFWLGPAPKRPYHPLRSHSTFRQFWDYSGGTFIDFWCHIVDVAVWALDLKAPRSMSAVGGRFFLTDETETPDTLEAMLEYPNLVFTFSFRPTPLPGFEHMGHIGCLFEGTEASLVTNYNKHEVWVVASGPTISAARLRSIPDSPGHIREFLDAIKTRNLETTCNVRYGHRVTKLGLLCNIAFRTGSRIPWDDEQERIVGNKDASPYLSREFRKDYKL